MNTDTLTAIRYLSIIIVGVHGSRIMDGAECDAPWATADLIHPFNPAARRSLFHKLEALAESVYGTDGHDGAGAETMDYLADNASLKLVVTVTE